MKKEYLIKSLRKQNFPEKIINAFERVDRIKFVPDTYKTKSYEDIPLPIGYGQTISQPYTIAFMLMLLELNDNQKILEVGSGSGYVLALISEISKNSEIYGVEIIKPLADSSKNLLKDKKNISVVCAQGRGGLSEKSPFNRILVSAASESIPQKLLKQLRVGGVMVVPVKNSILKIKKFANENKIEEFKGFVFVPLVK